MKIPKHYRNVNNHPQPKSAEELLAPNMQSEVQRTINEHPEIDTMNEEERGAIIDITDWRVNHNLEKPWGRKARNNDANNPALNTDGMTWLRLDGLFEIYDAISGVDGQSSWEGYGPYAPGENGYWWPPQPVDGTGPVPPTPGDLEERVEYLESTVAAQQQAIVELQTQSGEYANAIADLTARVGALESEKQQPLKAYGPINVPIVFESITSLRAKGDISVAVMPGEAEPPEMSGDNGIAHPLALW